MATKEVLSVIHTSEAKVASIEVSYGQLIFAEDARKVYFDGDTRTCYESIIKLANDAARQALLQPIIGFYFTIEECVLWYYTGLQWEQITSEPKDQVQFYNSRSDFPAEGESGVLYITGIDMYRWLAGSYIKMNSGSTPEWIEI